MYEEGDLAELSNAYHGVEIPAELETMMLQH